MRVAQRVHVPFRARDGAGRHVEDSGRRRGIEIALRSGLDLRVPALRDERREPADLEIAADDDQQVRLVQDQDEARLRLDEMRVLVALGQRRDLDLVAPHFLGDGRHVLSGGDNVERRARRDGGQQHGADGGDRYGGECFHDDLPLMSAD